MQRKELYRRQLPHFQQPGQAYFITWNLKDAVPKKAMAYYSKKLQELKLKLQQADESNTDSAQLSELKTAYSSTRKKYIYTYNQLLDANRDTTVDLTSIRNQAIIKEALHFWEDKKLANFAYCIMPNHVHWVIQVYEFDNSQDPVYLQDILHSVKLFSASKINKIENRQGNLWQKESFETTIRNEQHLYNAVEYTLNNPVSAGFVSDRNDWDGNYLSPDF